MPKIQQAVAFRTKGPLFRWLLVCTIGMAIGGFCFSTSLQAESETNSVLAIGNAALPPGIVMETQLPSGRRCKIDLNLSSPTTSDDSSIQRLKMWVNGTNVWFPLDAYSDLRNVHVNGKPDITEFAGTTYLLFKGGPPNHFWHAKFVVRDNRLIERQFSEGTNAAVTVRYLPEPTISGPFRLPTTNSSSLQLGQPQPILKGVPK